MLGCRGILFPSLCSSCPCRSIDLEWYHSGLQIADVESLHAGCPESQEPGSNCCLYRSCITEELFLRAKWFEAGTVRTEHAGVLFQLPKFDGSSVFFGSSRVCSLAATEFLSRCFSISAIVSSVEEWEVGLPIPPSCWHHSPKSILGSNISVLSDMDIFCW